MLTERLQVLVEHGQRERLERLARERGASVATLVREAIDRSFPPDTELREEAADLVLAVEPMAVGDVAELRQELREARGRRA